MSHPSAGSCISSPIASFSHRDNVHETPRVISEIIRSEVRRHRIQQPLLRIPRVADVAGDGMMPTAGTADRVRITSAALCSVTRVARLAEGNATFQGPVAQQTGHQKREEAQAGPSGCFAVTATGTRLVRAAHRHLVVHVTGDATAASAVRAMIEESLDAAQARRVVQDGLGRAQARVVAEPLAGQRGWLPARLASTFAAKVANNGEARRIVSGPRAESVGRFLGEGHWLLGDDVGSRCISRIGRSDRRGSAGRRCAQTLRPPATPRPMSRYHRGVLVTPRMTVMVMMVVLTMMPPLALGTIADDGLAVAVEASFLTAARVLERRLDVLVDGSLAVWSRRGETHLADGTPGRQRDRRRRRRRGRRRQ